MISVLYVDDEEPLLKLTKRYLEKNGNFTIDTAESAKEALDKVRATTYDAIVSDYQMPGMDGIEFLKTLRASGDTTPFIIFTGKGREEVVIEAINNGADFYVQKGGETKPQYAELVHKVTMAVERRLAIRELKNSEQRLADIINFLPDATFAINNEGTVIAWNRAIEEITGVPAADMLGKGDHEYAVPFYGVRRPILIDLILMPDEELTTRSYAVIKREGDILIAETSISRPLGLRKILFGKASLLRDQQGNIAGAIESIRDITDQKQAEESLRVSEWNYRSVIENIQDVFYRSDRDGNLAMASPSWASLLGYDTVEECIGKNIADTFYFYPDERKKFLHQVTTQEVVRNYEVILKRKDGTPVTVSTSSHIYFDDSGTVLGVEGIFRDITDQKQAEARLHAIVQGSPVPTFVIDLHHRVLSWNRALEEYSGIPADQVLGKPDAWRAFYPEERPSLADRIVDAPFGAIQQLNDERYAASTLMVGAYEATGFFPHMKGGTWLFFTAAPIRDASGQVIGAVETLQDITERKRAEDELKRKNEELLVSYERIAAAEEELRQNFDEIAAAANLLRESEERYRTVFENTGTATVLVEENTIISLANSGFEHLTGFSKKEIEGKKSWTEFVVQEDLDRMLAQHRLRRENRQTALKHYEFRIITRSGDIKTVFLSIDVIPGTKRSVASLLDISDRKRAEDETRASNEQMAAAMEELKSTEESLQQYIQDLKQSQTALRKSEERYRLLFDSAPDAVSVVDADGIIMEISKSAVQLYGYPREEMIGRQILQFLSPDSLLVFQQNVPQLRQMKTFQGEVRIVRNDGKTVKVWRKGVPLGDTEGVYKGAMLYDRDITVWDQMEQALRESEQRYYNIIEDQTEFICRFTPDGTHVFVNEAYARYFGKKRKDLLGKIFHPEVFPDDLEMVRNFFATLTPEHPVDYIQHRIIMPDGEVRWQRWSDRAIFDDSGAVIEYQSVGRDVSDQKRVEEALHIANTKLNILASITRHDIYNQLSVLDGYLEMLHDEVPDPDKDEYFDQIANASDMIRSIIRFTKEYEQIGVHVPVWKEIRSQLAVTGSTVDVGRINLVNQIPAGVEVYADPMIIKVFFNLLDNSIRHGQNVTEIRVSCRESDDTLTIIWEDNGIGIPDKEKSLIFKRDFGKHTGLGLFLSREILAITGITITENGELGKGARFEIRVPKGKYRFSGASSAEKSSESRNNV
ncbi:MAG: sensory histidine kinase AtoS [Methanoregulaceae archaeon PtaB.Bin108]|nr:MAG: sensory histidine kinase AtoS [Methanoregulaceae archaeon PtaB.Bin108]